MAMLQRTAGIGLTPRWRSSPEPRPGGGEQARRATAAGSGEQRRWIVLWGVVLAIGLVTLTMTSAAQEPRQALRQEAACQSLTPAAVGGPMPENPNVMVLRWLGHTNYEIAYRGTVILMDAYYERTPGNHPIGVTPGEFTRADAIVIGHPHFDHISDAATVARQTGATVIGASAGSEVVRRLGVPDDQIATVTGIGDEPFEFGGFTIQPVLGHHNVIRTRVPDGYLNEAAAAIDDASLQPPLTTAELQQSDAIRARGSRDPGIAARGTIGYLLSFFDGYRVMYVDSPGPVTEHQRRIAQEIQGVDIALLPFYARDAGIPPLLELVRLFRPETVLLGHHDGPGVAKWASIVPAALEIRGELPETRTLEPLYRAPVCVNTTTKDIFIGQ